MALWFSVCSLALLLLEWFVWASSVVLAGQISVG
jgi:hypothetical protein